MPTARSATATAAFTNRIYVAGGEVPMLFEVNEVYDPGADSWSCDAPMAIPRHGIAAVTLGDRILTPAGGIVAGLLPTNAVSSFIPPHPLGDVNGDCVVDVLDLIELLLCFGQPASGDCIAADVAPAAAPDGVINVLDLIQLLLDFAIACP